MRSKQLDHTERELLATLPELSEAEKDRLTREGLADIDASRTLWSQPCFFRCRLFQRANVCVGSTATKLTHSSIDRSFGFVPAALPRSAGRMGTTGSGARARKRLTSMVSSRMCASALRSFDRARSR